MVLLPGVRICPYVRGSAVITLDGTNVFGYTCLVYVYRGVQKSMCPLYACTVCARSVCVCVSGMCDETCACVGGSQRSPGKCYSALCGCRPTLQGRGDGLGSWQKAPKT